MLNLYNSKRAFCAALLMLTCGTTVAHSQSAAGRVELTNDFTLTWGATADAGGYEVVWRETTSPWQNVKTMPAGITRVTLDVSKDNVIFGVRTVGKSGNRSLPVASTPER